MENGSIVEQDIWDKGYPQYTLSVSQNQRENAFFERFLPARQGSALEIGCFPGRYLSLVGRKGYTLSGIDRTPRVAELPSWLTGSRMQSQQILSGGFLCMAGGITV